MKKTNLDHSLKRHFPVEPTGKPILDALLNASESFVEASNESNRALDIATCQDEPSLTTRLTGTYPKPRKRKITAQAQHSPWENDGSELVTTSEGEGFYCVDVIHSDFAVRKHNEVLEKLKWAESRMNALEKISNNAQRLADALAALLDANHGNRHWSARSKAREALADWNATESPADADALEALDQLEEQ